MIYKGMTVEEVYTAMSNSGKWEYIASGEDWYWFRSVKYGDVVEVKFINERYAEIDIL